VIVIWHVTFWWSIANPTCHEVDDCCNTLNRISLKSNYKRVQNVQKQGKASGLQNNWLQRAYIANIQRLEQHLQQAFFQHFYGSGCSWSLPVRWVLKLESLSFFPQGLEFFFSKTLKFWRFRVSFLKKWLVLVENLLEKHQIWHFLARFARTEVLFAHLQQKSWR